MFMKILKIAVSENVNSRRHRRVFFELCVKGIWDVSACDEVGLYDKGETVASSCDSFGFCECWIVLPLG